jgi:zinc transport system substrate-binding protein
MVGGGLDEWVAEVAGASGGDPTVVRLTEGIPLLAEDPDHDHGTGNPHIWLDPILVRDRLLPKVEESLIAAMPLAEEAIRVNAVAFSDSLTALDREIREALEGLEGRSFVVTHAAWSYFAVRYGLEEVGVVHPRPGHEPGGRELADLLELARDREIRCVFTEPQMGEAAARALTTELDLPSCLLDPLGGAEVEDRDGYLALLRFNTRMFLQGLGRREGSVEGRSPGGHNP